MAQLIPLYEQKSKLPEIYSEWHVTFLHRRHQRTRTEAPTASPNLLLVILAVNYCLLRHYLVFINQSSTPAFLCNLWGARFLSNMLRKRESDARFCFWMFLTWNAQMTSKSWSFAWHCWRCTFFSNTWKVIWGKARWGAHLLFLFWT